MASPDDAIIVDVPPSPRIKRGTGDANEPLELASSDSEDEKPRTPRPAKRPKPVPPSPSGNALLAQLRREREARRGPPPPPQPEVIQDAEGVRGLPAGHPSVSGALTKSFLGDRRNAVLRRSPFRPV